MGPDPALEDPLRGWAPADIVVLHDAGAYARENEATLEQFAREGPDPQSAAMVAREPTPAEPS